MTWNAPITWTDATVLTAAQLNSQLRDNMAAQAANQVTTYRSYVVSTNPNKLEERRPKKNTILDIGQTTSLSFGDLASGGSGPTVNVTTGTQALVIWGCGSWNSTNGVASIMSVAVSGATTISASNTNGLQFTNNNQFVANGSQFWYVDTLNPGVNTFTCQYAVSSASTGTFRRRRIFVYPF